MKTNQQYRIMAVLLLMIIVLLALCLVAGLVLGIVMLVKPSSPDVPEESTPNTQTSDTSTSVDPIDTLLAETADAGQVYIDSMIFFGESTTAHLRARGVLKDGTSTHQVWSDSSGTKTLSSRITSEPIVYPPTGENLMIDEACRRERPAYIVLSFGLNGITGFIKDKNSFVNNYARLITAIQKASPDTKIILQTVYPVCGSGNYSVDVATLNGYIMTLNEWITEVAAGHENVRVADTASVLRDADGRLKAEFDNGDGIHLTEGAYREILYYLRTHSWQ